MKEDRVRKGSESPGREARNKDQLQISSLRLLAGGLLIIALAAGFYPAVRAKTAKVYAASEEYQEENLVPAGVSGVLSGVSRENKAGTQINRVGTSCENVLVGQRVRTVANTGSFTLTKAMQKSVDSLDQKAISMAASPTLMSDEDYDTLLRIVESEAGEDDIKGRVLVANVIMNRIKRPDYPDTVTDVVFQYVNGVPQFSPVYFGTIYTVTVTDETREAVRQALSGVDYSQGALFFIQRSAAEKDNITWFDTDLKRLFKHGVHEFYVYKDETDPLKQNPDYEVLEAEAPENEDEEDKEIRLVLAE